jgi:hypothetical protein
VLIDHRLELVAQMREPLRQRRGGVGLQLPVGDVRQAIAISKNDGPASGS